MCNTNRCLCLSDTVSVTSVSTVRHSSHSCLKNEETSYASFNEHPLYCPYLDFMHTSLLSQHSSVKRVSGDETVERAGGQHQASISSSLHHARPTEMPSGPTSVIDWRSSVLDWSAAINLRIDNAVPPSEDATPRRTEITCSVT